MTHLGLPPVKSTQTIEFPINGGEETAAVFAENVGIVPSTGDHVSGSSKVKLNNIVDYSWEEKFYPGQLLAVHMSGNYIAYSIKGANYAVRVVNRETGKRALIKGIGAMVEDLAFAFIPHQITLACVDESGAVYIHNIYEDSREITTSLLLHILQMTEVTVPRRVFWCPYIPDETEMQQQDPYSDETSLLLAVTRDNKIEIWNVASVSSMSCGPVRADKASGACVQISAHESTIVDAAFSPDGTAIATASIDGECKFFQVYMQSDCEPTCLHRWKPHGGKPVTSLFFLDDHKCANPEIKFWKYAVTGTDDNCELKLWTCETWKCLQTIRFCSKSSKRHCKLKASVDLSAGYIFVSDMFRKILFVLELEKNNNETVPFIRTATEFKLPCPILSFAIVEAGPQSKGNPIFSDEGLMNGEDDENQPSVMVRMYLVQPKSLQECQIVFNTHLPVTQTSPIGYDKNGLDEVQAVMAEPSISQPSLNLMTPDAFHSPHTSESTPALSRNGGTPAVDVSYPGNVVIANGDPPNDAGGGSERRRGFVSGGSSPSREVEEILSSPRFYSGEAPTTTKSHAQVKSVEMYEKLRSLETTVEALHSEVTALCHAINVQSTSIQNLQEEVIRNKGTSISEVEGIITNAVSTYKPVSEEDIVNTITPMITQAILTVINPAVVKSMADLQSMVHEEVSSKLSSTDSVLKENISKIMKSKPFSEMMTRSLSTAVSQAMEPVFRESFTRTVVPMFESACANMFMQLNETFTKGLNESMKHLNDRANMEILTLQSATERISQTAQHFSATVEKETKGLEDTVIEVERRLKACVNGAAVRSGTVTPAQHLVDPHLIQSQVSLLVKQGQYNTAFQQALSASDLSIVSYVCEKVDLNKVFTRCGCVLQQHVLLSLIQQLAADMSSHTDTKQRYLEAAVMNLLPNNENTREHMPQVLSGLQKQLQMFTSSTNDPHLANKAKLLAMACQQMVRNLKDDWVN